MADEVDRAKAWEESQLQIHLNQHFASQAQGPDHGPGSEDCIDCGDVIPEQRRTAVPGVERCVDCQSQAEGGR